MHVDAKKYQVGTGDVFMYNLAFCGENDEREEDHENTQHTCTHKIKLEPGVETFGAYQRKWVTK